MIEKNSFKLYLSGRTPSNKRIIKDLKSILEDKFKDQYALDIIYVTEDSASAEDEKVICTPTLIKYLPLPATIFAGNLTNRKKLLFAVEESVKQME